MDIRVKSYDDLNFSRASVVQFRASQYIMHLNRTSIWKVVIIWISRELSFFNFDRLSVWCTWIGHPSEMVWPLEFVESFRCSISCVSICHTPELDIRGKSYYHLNFSRASVVQFRASRYIMRLNRTSSSKRLCFGATSWVWLSCSVSKFRFLGLEFEDEDDECERKEIRENDLKSRDIITFILQYLCLHMVP